MTLLIRDRATEAQVEEILEELGIYIKVAVDIDHKILAGGGYLHTDCEGELLSGQQQAKSNLGSQLEPLYSGKRLRNVAFQH